MMKASCETNYAIPPGETLRETLETIGMTQVELAARTGRPKKTINEIIAGKAAITAKTALQLERCLEFLHHSGIVWREITRKPRQD